MCGDTVDSGRFFYKNFSLFKYLKNEKDVQNALCCNFSNSIVFDVYFIFLISCFISFSQNQHLFTHKSSEPSLDVD